MKVAMWILLISLVWAGIAFGGETYEKVNDYAMTIVQEARTEVSRGNLEQEKAVLEKALVRINSLLGEADKLGVTKVDSDGI